jgi:hypothetical protein
MIRNAIYHMSKLQLEDACDQQLEQGLQYPL